MDGIGLGWKSPGGVRYSTPYGANNKIFEAMRGWLGNLKSVDGGGLEGEGVGGRPCLRILPPPVQRATPLRSYNNKRKPAPAKKPFHVLFFTKN